MRKALLSIVTVLGCYALFTACNKSSVVNTQHSMTVLIDSSHFSAAIVTPSTTKGQVTDTATKLDISGYLPSTGEKMILSILKYKGQTGIFSVVKNEAQAQYIHNGFTSNAIGGVITITSITSNSIIGSFTYDTQDSLKMTSGAFNVSIP